MFSHVWDCFATLAMTGNPNQPRRAEKGCGLAQLWVRPRGAVFLILPQVGAHNAVTRRALIRSPRLVEFECARIQLIIFALLSD